jgi:hypothetical protein
MFSGLQDPDPLVKGPNPDASFIMQKNRKTLISTVLRLLYDFLALMTYFLLTS